MADEENINITVSERMNKTGYVGVVIVKERGVYLWSETTPITRISRIDAMFDAKQRKLEILESISPQAEKREK